MPENHLHLNIEDDAKNARLLIKPGWPHGALTRDAILAFLKSKKIADAAIDQHAVAELLSATKEAQDKPHDALVARGTPPLPGDNATFELAEDIAARFQEIEAREKHSKKTANQEPPPPSPDTDDSSRQDHYSFSPYVIVERGQTLGTIVPPTQGVDGSNVRGETVHARHGEECRWKFGQGTYVDDNGQVTATTAGHLIRRHEALSVSPVLRVAEAVDFNTGHIRFPGDVEVGGGVRDRFMVGANGSLRVRGLVQAATIETGGDAKLDTGMAGRSTGTLDIGGTLEVGYLEAVVGCVARDLKVKGQMYNCQFFVGGSVISPKCAVRGGRLDVAGRIEIGSLGAAAGTATTVSYAHDESLSPLGNNLIQQLSMLEKIAKQAAAQRERAERAPIGAPGSSNDLMVGQQAHEMATKCIASVRNSAARLIRIAERTLGDGLTVHGDIHPGATILAPGWTITVHSGFRGPARFCIDHEGNPVIEDLADGTTRPATIYADVEPDDTIPDWLKIRNFASDQPPPAEPESAKPAA